LNGAVLPGLDEKNSGYNFMTVLLENSNDIDFVQVICYLSEGYLGV